MSDPVYCPFASKIGVGNFLPVGPISPRKSLMSGPAKVLGMT